MIKINGDFESSDSHHRMNKSNMLCWSSSLISCIISKKLGRLQNVAKFINTMEVRCVAHASCHYSLMVVAVCYLNVGKTSFPNWLVFKYLSTQAFSRASNNVRATIS